MLMSCIGAVGVSVPIYGWLVRVGCHDLPPSVVSIAHVRQLLVLASATATVPRLMLDGRRVPLASRRRDTRLIRWCRMRHRLRLLIDASKLGEEGLQG